jgi:predicted RNase H-like nuclease
MGGVLGLDGCKAGWIGIVLSETESATAVFGPTIDDVVSAATDLTPVTVIGVDIPIGIPESGPRQADALARQMLGSRASSVFSTPVRAALEADVFSEANELSRALSGKGLTRQSYALREKILEFDAYLARSRAEIIEVHPEVAFAQMNGTAVPWSKKTWAGHARRRELLARHGIELPRELGPAGAYAAVDDVLDAAAVAWIALHHAHGRSRSLPDPPEPMSRGGTGAIWISAGP